MANSVVQAEGVVTERLPTNEPRTKPTSEHIKPSGCQPKSEQEGCITIEDDTACNFGGNMHFIIAERQHGRRGGPGEHTDSLTSRHKIASALFTEEGLSLWSALWKVICFLPTLLSYSIGGVAALVVVKTYWQPDNMLLAIACGALGVGAVIVLWSAFDLLSTGVKTLLVTLIYGGTMAGILLYILPFVLFSEVDVRTDWMPTDIRIGFSAVLSLLYAWLGYSLARQAYSAERDD